MYDLAPELSNDKVEAVVDTWAIAKKNPMESGAEFYFTFFKHFPQYTTFFKEFSGTPVNELRSHPKLRLHGIRVLYAISSIIESLDDLDIAGEIMRKTVDNHYPRGLQESDFKNLFTVVPVFVAAKAGDVFTETARHGWDTVLGYLLDVIRGRFKELAVQ